jgi:hypothetical protein
MLQGGLADFRDILRGADCAEEAQGEVFGFVIHKRNVSFARLAGAQSAEAAHRTRVRAGTQGY